MKSKFIFTFAASLICLEGIAQNSIGHTEITKWPDGKSAAVSLTYDDGTLNQFHVALPIMQELDMKGTFYINTGEIPGARFPAKFIGRDHEEIIEETATIPTDKTNIFERASLVRFLDMDGAVAAHDRIGTAYEQGREAEAYKMLDDAFAKARSLGITNLKSPEIIDGPMISWDEIREYAKVGHEFGVHTISHPKLAVLDEPNLLYELEKCKDEIRKELGREHLFSAECPFGTEDERVMEYALDMFPALRNRMPEPFLEEINRSGKFDPKNQYEKEYVQYQRGPLSKTSPDLMRSWVDDVLTRDDTWLVLVFHGIDGIGWEAIPENIIRDYFEYIHSKRENLWVATFGYVTKYMRERMHSKVDTQLSEDSMTVDIQNDLDNKWYNIPLTLKTYVDESWSKVSVRQRSNNETLSVQKDGSGSYIQYSVLPNGGKIFLKSL